MMKKWNKYAQAIQESFPNLELSTFHLAGEGDNSLAFLVDNKWIFRFPKNEEGKASIQSEGRLLDFIRPLVNLRIPQFEFFVPDSSFVGYESIPGTPLHSALYFSQEEEVKQSALHSIAGFLTSLHAIPASGLPERLLPLLNFKEEYSANFKDIQHFIYPNLPESSKEMIRALFQTYLNENTNFTFQPALIHNDFSGDHIFFDPASKVVTGIIDFGDMALGDPDYDLMYLYDQFGPEFIIKLIDPLPFRGGQMNFEKLRFFSLANKLQILLEEVKGNSRAAKDAWQVLFHWIAIHKNSPLR